MLSFVRFNQGMPGRRCLNLKVDGYDRCAFHVEHEEFHPSLFPGLAISLEELCRQLTPNSREYANDAIRPIENHLTGRKRNC